MYNANATKAMIGVRIKKAWENNNIFTVQTKLESVSLRFMIAGIFNALYK